MAFGNKKLEKQDLIDAGVDPDLLVTLRDQGVKKTDLDALKAEMNTTIADQIKAGFTELEKKLRPEPTTTTTTTEEEEEPTDYDRFATNPTEYVKSEVNKMGFGAAVEIMETRRQMAYDNAVNNLRGFKNATLRAEIDEELKKYPAAMLARNKGNPVILIKQIHDMVLGNHHDDIVQDTNKRDGKYNLVHSGSGSGSTVVSDSNNGGGGGDGKRTLSEQEKKIAKKYGMTDDEWIQQEKDSEAEENLRHKVGA